MTGTHLILTATAHASIHILKDYRSRGEDKGKDTQVKIKLIL